MEINRWVHQMYQVPELRLSRSDVAFIGSFALLKVLIHLPVLTRYGYHHDEFYFIACGRHLSFGYVDHPPIVPWIARLAESLSGQSLFGLRTFSLLAGVVVILLTGLLAKRLGGGRFAQATACLSVIVAPVFLRTDNMFCIPAFEQPLWILCCYLLVRIVQERKPRLWIWFGLTAGLGLMVKHSMLFFGFGVAAALILTEQRRQFRSPWLYAGAGTAVLVFLPNLVWQAANGWPTVVFLRHLNQGTMSGISLLQFVSGQVLYLGPVTAPIWIAGLVYYFSESGRPYRFLGWIKTGLTKGRHQGSQSGRAFMELLDVGHSIVLVIDLQGKLMELIERPGLVVAGTIRLLKLAGLFEVPVVMTEQYPRGLGATHAGIRAAFDALATPKRLLEKTSFGCCGDPGFEKLLTELRPGLKPERRQLIVAGIEAHVCVMQTVIELLNRGSRVHLCWECISGRGAEYRRHALDRMTQAGAVLTNHESVGFEWARHKDHRSFKAMSALFKEGQPNG